MLSTNTLYSVIVTNSIAARQIRIMSALTLYFTSLYLHGPIGGSRTHTLCLANFFVTSHDDNCTHRATRLTTFKHQTHKTLWCALRVRPLICWSNSEDDDFSTSLHKLFSPHPGHHFLLVQCHLPGVEERPHISWKTDEHHHGEREPKVWLSCHVGLQKAWDQHGQAAGAGL